MRVLILITILLSLFSMIKLVAFDWNGTLLADTNIWWRAASKQWEFLGGHPVPLKRLQETFTIPIINYFVVNGFKRKDILKNKNEIAAIFFKHYNPKEALAHTRGGSRQLLKWLKANNIESIIYSNHSVTDIHKQLKRLKLTNYIVDVIGRHEDEMIRQFDLKHKEDRLKEYLKSNKLKSAEVLTIGDTCEEIEIGRALKLRTVALSGGYNSTKRLKACKPDFLIHNLKSLVPIIKKLNK